MKAFQREISVDIQPDGAPRQISWEGRCYPVQVIMDSWRAGGRWWLDERARECFLVQAGPLTAEVYREDTPGGRWWLARMQD